VARAYRAWCATCNTEWTGEEADESDVPAGEARVFFVCLDCGHIGRTSIRRPVKELIGYRRAIRKTIGKMVESFMRARARLDERRRALRLRIREGEEDAAGALELVEERLAGLVSPDVDHLERRAEEVERAESTAPVRTSPVACSECGGETHLHRETPHGYDMTCPRCEGKVYTRVG
jgi:DNA-directed RNA polymerase subunit RPC12/RpoP